MSQVNYINCDVCNKKQELESTYENWEWNCYHFKDCEVNFLACEDCKIKNPITVFDILSKRPDFNNMIKKELT